MSKFALLKNVEFGIASNSTHELVIKYLNDKVSFYDFNGTIDLFYKLYDHLGKHTYEIDNCEYDKKYIIQAIYVDDPNKLFYEKIILIKREIITDDTYSYNTFSFDETKICDNYIYADIEMSDIEQILWKKYHSKGVKVTENGDINDINYSFKFDELNNDIGKITLFDNDGNFKNEYNFIDVNNVRRNNENLNSEQHNEILMEKINKYNIQFIYSQHEFNLGILNIFSPINGNILNEKVSYLINTKFYGDIILCLENNLNNDESRILDMSVELFTKILKLKSIPNFKPKNKYFINIFNELLLL
jgi:hypothetical protein